MYLGISNQESMRPTEATLEDTEEKKEHYVRIWKDIHFPSLPIPKGPQRSSPPKFIHSTQPIF